MYNLCIEFALCNGTISHDANIFFFLPTRPENITPVSLRWERSHNHFYSPHLKKKNNSSDSQGTTCSLQMRKSLIWHLLLKIFYDDHNNHPLAKQLTKYQTQKEELCEHEETNSLKWRQCLIVRCDMSLTTSCWTYFPFTAVMDFPPKASRRPLGAERLPLGIFLTTSQGFFCFCCLWDPSPHAHMGTPDVRGWRSPE